MNEARAAIADLDRELRKVGEDIVLQRLVTDPDTGAQSPSYIANCRANVRAHQPQELQFMAGEAPVTVIVLSPTDLARELWPGLPQKDDRAIVQGRSANVEIVSPIYVGGTLVRIDLQTRE